VIILENIAEIKQEIIKLFSIEDETVRFNRLKELKKVAKDNEILTEFNNTYKMEIKIKDKFDKESTFEFKINHDMNGHPEKTIENITNILDNDKKYRGKLKYNEIKEFPEFNGKNMTDNLLSDFLNHIETKYDIYDENKLIHSINCVSEKYKYNPIKDMIESVVWDKVERLEYALIRWLKTEDNPYSMEVSRLIFAGRYS